MELQFYVSFFPFYDTLKDLVDVLMNYTDSEWNTFDTLRNTIREDTNKKIRSNQRYTIKEVICFPTKKFILWA